MAEREDLAAMIGPVVRELVSREQPILREHGLSMWGYVVLLNLDEQPVHTQAALAEAIHADKTRLIAVLDDLQAAGLIERQPAPGDRRARILTITPEGRRLRDTARTAIQTGEEDLLGVLTPEQRTIFLDALRALSAAVRGSAEQ